MPGGDALDVELTGAEAEVLKAAAEARIGQVQEDANRKLRALEGELSSRRYGDAVRLEVSEDCPEELTAFLAAQFNLDRDLVYRCEGPVNLMRLAALPDLVERPDLKYPGFTPSIPDRIRNADAMFDAIRAGEILLT